MKNLSSDVHEHDRTADDKLYELLKEGSNSPGDEEKGTTKETIEVYDEPEEEGARDGNWGEKDNNPTFFSDAALREFKEGREKLLKRLFDHPPADSRAEGLSKKASPETVLERVRHLTGRE